MDGLTLTYLLGVRLMIYHSVGVLTRNQKRKRLQEEELLENEPPLKKKCLTAEFLQECQENFAKDPKNRIVKNACISVGPILAATDQEKAKKISHIFLNTVKEKGVKATDQGVSGRCWIFAGLNMFRHHIIQALGIEHFEFSANYLFFWDKWERANTFFLNMVKESDSIRKTTLQQVYTILIDYLGEPPKKFNWSFQTKENTHDRIKNLTPLKFKELTLANRNITDFVVLTCLPSEEKPYYQKYALEASCNIEGKDPFSFINIPVNYMVEFVQNSLNEGQPVWFAGDVTKGFHPYKGALSEDLIDYSLLFGEEHSMSKEQSIKYLDRAANHAMCFIGYDTDDNGVANRWQVENSWGFLDHEVSGMDGFLAANDQWFKNNCFQVVIHKDFLKTRTRNIERKIHAAIESDPTYIKPWDTVAPALKVSGKTGSAKNAWNQAKQFPHLWKV